MHRLAQSYEWLFVVWLLWPDCTIYLSPYDQTLYSFIALFPMAHSQKNSKIAQYLGTDFSSAFSALFGALVSSKQQSSTKTILNGSPHQQYRHTMTKLSFGTFSNSSESHCCQDSCFVLCIPSKEAPSITSWDQKKNLLVMILMALHWRHLIQLV